MLDPPATCIDELQRQRMFGAEEHNGQDKAFPCRELTPTDVQLNLLFEPDPEVPSTKRIPSKHFSGKPHYGHFEVATGVFETKKHKMKVSI